MIPGQQFVPRILIAEDSPVCRKLLETILEKKPYELCSIANGREALGDFAQFCPDIINADWIMPDLSGIELCRQIRKGPDAGAAIGLYCGFGRLKVRRAHNDGEERVRVVGLSRPEITSRGNASSARQNNVQGNSDGGLCRKG